MKLNNFKLSHIDLVVKDREVMLKFYTERLGFEVLSATEDIIDLGVSGQLIVRFHINPNAELSNQQYEGLYHLAIRLPSEKDLGHFILHSIAHNYPISGAGDHIFSQALYFNDPEMNGIEIYTDRPQSEWNENEDGTLEAATLSVDIQNLIDQAPHEPWTGLPIGTDLGHVHLQVSDLSAARSFYLNTLNYDLKTDVQSAIFISHNGYHHDFGINRWNPNLKKATKSLTGLRSITLVMDDVSMWHPNHINESFTLTDPSGIQLIYTPLNAQQ